MATENLSITSNDIHQLKSLLSQIALMASQMSDSAATIVMEGDTATAKDAVIIDRFAKTVGWMADYGTSLVGGGQGFKGAKAESWMLPNKVD